MKIDNGTRAVAAANYVKWSLFMGAALGFVGAAIFHNIFAGLAGWVVSTIFSLFWWRPNGPGRRRFESAGGSRRTPDER
jgi:hypothetical protein